MCISSNTSEFADALLIIFIADESREIYGRTRCDVRYCGLYACVYVDFIRTVVRFRFVNFKTKKNEGFSGGFLTMPRENKEIHN